MADDDIAPDAAQASAWTAISTVVMWVFVGVFAVALIGVALVKLADTKPGQKWLVAQAARYQPDSGLRIGIGRIEGTIFGKLVVSDLTLRDPRGTFLEAGRVTLDWRPQGLIRRRLHINSLEAPEIRVLHKPELIPSDEEKPILPDFDIYVGKFDLQRVILEKPVLGKRQLLRAEGSADIADGRLLAALQASSPTGGDTLIARIDSRPDDNRFDISGRLNAPPGGVVAGLLKTDKPLIAAIDGEGSWKRWAGTLRSSLGGQDLADLSLTSTDGLFTVRGVASPGLIVGGLVRKFGSPQVRIDATATMDERRIDTTIALLSPSIDLDAKGRIDLGESRFENFKVAADLLDPKALIKTLKAKDMHLDLALDGPLSAPDIVYRLTSDWLAVGTTRLDRVVAIGKGRIPKDRLAFPIDVATSRVTGVGEFVEELATNVRVRGELRIEGPMLVGNRLAVKTDRITAIADLRLNTRTGAYNVDATGTLPRYPVPGFGIVDVAADLNFIPDPANPRQLRVRGQTTAKVARLDNEFLAWLFGGRPDMSARIDRNPNGTIAITGAELRAPDMRINGSGTYSLGQKIDFDGKAISKRFGPFLVALSGLINRPEASVRLQKYSAGIELSDVRARFVPGPNAYAFTMTADSVAGPVAARGRIVTDPGQTLYDVEALDIAGLTASGKLRPVNGAAAVAGVLDVRGHGIDGTVRLSPEDAVQRFDASLTARSARLSFPSVASIRRGTLAGTLVLASDGADISGRFDLEGVTRGELFVKSAKGTLEMKDGEGSAIVIASGERGAPFTLDLAASFDKNSMAITTKGSIARQPFSFDTPARLSAIDGGWRLAPVVLNLPEGTARISGTFARTTTLSADLKDAGLELFELALPGVGLSGSASGRLAMIFTPGALPRGTAKLRVTDFTRVSQAFATPVDMAVVAMLEPNKAVVRAVFQNGTQRLGTLQARLLSIPGDIDDPWSERLAEAPIAAQLRWRGPAEMLWPLTGVGAISMRGNVGVSIEIGGLLGSPMLNGLVRSNSVRIESAITGTAIESIKLDGRFTGSRLELSNFSGTAGKGSISGNGHIDLSLSRGFPIDIAMVLRSADMLNRDDLRATASGPLRIRNDPDGAVISGDLTIDKARFRIGRTAQAEIETLKVRETNRDLVRAEASEVEPTIWQLDVRARADNQIDVRGMGLDSEWSANLDIKGSANAPRLTGTAKLIRGDYEFAGRRFELTRGELRFTGGYPPDPVIDIAAEARVDGLTATIAIRGTGQHPDISFASIPALPQDEVLSRVLFGTSITNLSAPEALQLAGAVASLQGGGQGLNPINAVRRAVGLDRLRVLEANSVTGQKTALAAGEYITDRVYVEVATDAQGYTATQLEIELTRALSVLSQVATLGGTSVNLRWSKDY